MTSQWGRASVVLLYDDLGAAELTRLTSRGLPRLVNKIAWHTLIVAFT
ncbi:hypothetical protein [Streptomyces sp. NPDC001635]